MEGVTANAERVEANGSAFFPIERPRVMARLARAASFDIAMIIAPAGYGKSTALRQYVRSIPRCVIFKIAPERTEFSAFIADLAVAFGPICPALARSAANAVAKSADDVPSIARWFLAHLDGAEATVAIDDFHLCNNDFRVLAFLEAVLTDDLPSRRIRWIIASRAQPSLPTASWIAYGRSDISIDASDLRFTPDEYAAAAKACGTALSESKQEGLFRLLDGWPAGLLFTVRLAGEPIDDVRLTARTLELAYAYFAEQVWRSMLPRSREFFYAMLYLPHITRDLAVASGFADCAADLTQLLASVPCVLRLDHDTYMLHDLFRGFLTERAYQAGAAFSRELIRVAGWALLQVGDIFGSLDRFVTIKDTGAIAQVLRDHGLSILERNLSHRCKDAIALADDRSSCAILALRAAEVERTGDYEGSIALFRDALKATISATDRTRIASRLARTVGQAGTFTFFKTAEVLDELLRLYRKVEDATSAARADFGIRLAQALVQKVGSAAEGLRIASSLNVAYIDGEQRNATLIRRATIEFYAGNVLGARAMATKGCEGAIAQGDYWSAYHAETLICAALGSLGDYAAADERAPRILEFGTLAGETFQFPYVLACSTVWRSRLGRWEELATSLDPATAGCCHDPLGNHSSAMAYTYKEVAIGNMDAAFFAAHSHNVGDVPASCRPGIASIRGLTAAVTGRVIDAHEAIEEFYSVRGDMPQHVYPVDYALNAMHACVALVIASNGKDDRCRRLIDDIDNGRIPWTGDISRALHQAMMGSTERAVESLNALDEGGLLGVAQFVRALLPYIVAAAPRLLTETELRVLRHLSACRTNPEIAAIESVSANTVKTHVSSILRKLRATRRAEAVSKARAANVLPS